VEEYPYMDVVYRAFAGDSSDFSVWCFSCSDRDVPLMCAIGAVTKEQVLHEYLLPCMGISIPMLLAKWDLEGIASAMQDVLLMNK
jgi:hypothetical protein